jgi:hypothetical protein
VEILTDAVAPLVAAAPLESLVVETVAVAVAEVTVTTAVPEDAPMTEVAPPEIMSVSIHMKSH